MLGGHGTHDPGLRGTRCNATGGSQIRLAQPDNALNDLLKGNAPRLEQEDEAAGGNLRRADLVEGLHEWHAGRDEGHRAPNFAHVHAIICQEQLNATIPPHARSGSQRRISIIVVLIRIDPGVCQEKLDTLVLPVVRRNKQRRLPSSFSLAKFGSIRPSARRSSTFRLLP